jgi:outer membrane lipoprotein SlyB
MKKLFVCTTVMVSLLPFAGAAEAKGCIKGAIVGGIAGKMVGHGKVGAAAGCAVGHHRAAKSANGADQQR